MQWAPSAGVLVSFFCVLSRRSTNKCVLRCETLYNTSICIPLASWTTNMFILLNSVHVKRRFRGLRGKHAAKMPPGAVLKNPLFCDFSGSMLTTPVIAFLKSKVKKPLFFALQVPSQSSPRLSFALMTAL